ncbi:AbiJ-NTD4 domain-containing protein [Legionella feeleii]|uniref:HEPN AbiJ-N-terminal domain-containing protein n=1 Tax=Legionella feeleii TaxID=453 RepID=A0A378J6E7_9GAMM|nr:hypothetical protein [Legionella feeleii]STX39854.1 Uncharacterised protein [Legionella feeleii]
MGNFSHRMGLKSIVPIQKDSINEALRNGAWTIVYEVLRKNIEYSITGYEPPGWGQKSAKIIRNIWVDFFKLASDSISWNPEKDISYLKDRFYSLEWNDFYDFIEFFSQLIDSYERKSTIQDFNRIFKRKNSAYTFVNEIIIEKISETEMEVVEETKNLPKQPFEHIKNASRLLFDRVTPDYRNSVKESISALESFMRNLTNSDKQLGDILKTTDFSIFNIHPALNTAVKDSMNKLYGYSSDQSGVRHSLKENHLETTKEEAWFILVTSSSLMNYLQSCIKQ